jgi:hypothetical protein
LTEGLRVGKAGKLGRGVFATRDYAKFDLIECAPLIVIESQQESETIDRDTILGAYCYEHDDGRICLGLGYASLYNHSIRPNAAYTIFDDMIEIRALRPIKTGAQIKINYNGNPEDRTKINFRQNKPSWN